MRGPSSNWPANASVSFSHRWDPGLLPSHSCGARQGSNRVSGIFVIAGTRWKISAIYDVEAPTGYMSTFDRLSGGFRIKIWYIECCRPCSKGIEEKSQEARPDKKTTYLLAECLHKNIARRVWHFLVQDDVFIGGQTDILRDPTVSLALDRCQVRPRRLVIKCSDLNNDNRLHEIWWKFVPATFTVMWYGLYLSYIR